MRREFFQPYVVVVVQAALVVVDEDGRGDVHRVHQHQPFVDAGLAEAFIDLGRDVDERTAAFDLEPEFLAVTFHTVILAKRSRACNTLKMC